MSDGEIQLIKTKYAYKVRKEMSEEQREKLLSRIIPVLCIVGIVQNIIVFATQPEYERRPMREMPPLYYEPWVKPNHPPTTKEERGIEWWYSDAAIDSWVRSAAFGIPDSYRDLQADFKKLPRETLCMYQASVAHHVMDARHRHVRIDELIRDSKPIYPEAFTDIALLGYAWQFGYAPTTREASDRMQARFVEYIHTTCEQEIDDV